MLGTLALAAWLVDWFFIREVVYHDQSVASVGQAYFIAVIAIAFTTFFFIVNARRLYNGVFAGLVLIGYLMLMPKNEFVILGGGLFMGLILLFEWRIRSEEKTRQDFSIRKVASASISLLVYGLLLLVGFNSYYNLQTSFNSNPEAYYAKFTQATSKTTPLVARNFTELSADQQKELADNLSQQAVDKIKQSLVGHEKYVPFVFALIITSLLWGFAFVFRWIAVVLTWAIFQLLLAIKFFRIVKVPVEVQKLEI